MEFFGHIIEFALRMWHADRQERDEGMGKTKIEKRFRRVAVWFGIGVLVFFVAVCFAWWWWVARGW